MSEKALLLTCGDASSQNDNIAKLLGFFGVTWQELTTGEFLADSAKADKTPAKIRLFCSSDTFAGLISDLERGEAGFQFWENIHSVFIYAGDDADVLEKLAKRLAENPGVAVEKMKSHDRDFVVSNELNEFCGVMAGVRLTASKAAVESSYILTGPSGNATSILSANSESCFSKFNHQGTAIFLATCPKIIDLEAELKTGVFDIRNYLLPALPIVLYVKWALGKQCWQAAEANACLVIDDPLLKPVYGFVNFEELLVLMKRHRFSTNIAFIPWNWQRSSPEVIRLFKENPEEYSLSVHGCDHTRAEFGSLDRQDLYRKARQGIERMANHEVETGIHHDPVMVFPQGVFSEAAMSALKHTRLIAALSNDTISVDPHPRAITVSDVWDVAIMGYSNFPLFTRRYPWEGVENFAFDILLGKPCIVVIHHDFCREGYQRLVNFIDRLNALKVPLSWRSLGEVVRRSCRQKEPSSDTVEVEMYGTELRVANQSGQAKRFLIDRRESDPATLKSVSAGSHPVEWKFFEGRIHFEMELSSGQHQTVLTTYQDLNAEVPNNENFAYKTRIMFRRYLSEVRDNYLMKYQKRWSIDGQVQKNEDNRRRTEGSALISEAGD